MTLKSYIKSLDKNLLYFRKGKQKPRGRMNINSNEFQSCNKRIVKRVFPICTFFFLQHTSLFPFGLFTKACCKYSLPFIPLLYPHSSACSVFFSPVSYPSDFFHFLDSSNNMLERLIPVNQLQPQMRAKTILPIQVPCLQPRAISCPWLQALSGRHFPHPAFTQYFLQKGSE